MHFGLLQRVINLRAQGRSLSEIVIDLRKSHTYIAKLHRIARDTDPQVIVQWRMMSQPLSVEAMTHVAKLPRLEQEADFVRRCQSKWRGRSRIPVNRVVEEVRKAHAALYNGRVAEESDVACHCQVIGIKPD